MHTAVELTLERVIIHFLEVLNYALFLPEGLNPLRSRQKGERKRVRQRGGVTACSEEATAAVSQLDLPINVVLLACRREESDMLEISVALNLSAYLTICLKTLDSLVLA